MTSEAYSSPEECLRHVEKLDSLRLMELTSRQVISDVQNVYQRAHAEETGIGIALFGSPSRFEMLPYSDVDVLILQNQNSPEASRKADYIRRNIKALSYDKIDTPQTITNTTQLAEIATSNSPDGQAAHCLLIAEPPVSTLSQEVAHIRSIIESSHFQLENLIFGYHFLSHIARLKEADDGANLKYSDGGARDFLYLNWAANFTTNNAVARQAHETGTPMLSLSLPVVMGIIGEPDSIDTARDAINFINTAKHYALVLSKAGFPFDGKMSHQTAELLKSHFYQEPSIVADMLITAHSVARDTIRSIKDKLYDTYCNQLLMQAREGDESSRRLAIIDAMWRLPLDNPNRATLLDELIERGKWAELATAIAQPDISVKGIEKVTEIALQQPGFAYALRLVIQHPRTPRTLLVKLLDHQRIAADDDIDIRYRGIIRKRLGLAQ